MTVGEYINRCCKSGYEQYLFNEVFINDLSTNDPYKQGGIIWCFCQMSNPSLNPIYKLQLHNDEMVVLFQQRKRVNPEDPRTVDTRVCDMESFSILSVPLLSSRSGVKGVQCVSSRQTQILHTDGVNQDSSSIVLVVLFIVGVGTSRSTKIVVDSR